MTEFQEKRPRQVWSKARRYGFLTFEQAQAIAADPQSIIAHHLSSEGQGNKGSPWISASTSMDKAREFANDGDSPSGYILVIRTRTPPLRTGNEFEQEVLFLWTIGESADTALSLDL